MTRKTLKTAQENSISLKNFMKFHSSLITEPLIKTITWQLLSTIKLLQAKRRFIKEFDTKQIFLNLETHQLHFNILEADDDNYEEEIKSNLWVIGILFLKMAKFISKNNRLNQFKLIQMVSEGNSIEEIEISDNAWSLLKGLLSKNPKFRVSADIALCHQFFEEYRLN